ncbi:MAG: septum site-determining protein MinC [Vulcanococcus sp.]
MAEPLPPATPLRRFRLLALAEATASPLEEVQHQLASAPPPGPALLDGADRPLTLPELQAIQAQLAAAQLELRAVESLEPLSLVPAAALGLATALLEPSEAAAASEPAQRAGLSIHRGTLRAGDHLQVEGALLVLGDVNPGARVSAAGDVRVWGRLRGVAHAGCRGDRRARIVALQLRPLQLRIAEAVARGPEDQPPAGFCEEAVLLDGGIAIRPAEPSWPAELNG